MHIALVNQWYPPETGGGGVATHNLYFAEACIRLGHRVTVIAERPTKDTRPRRLLKGVEVLRVPSPDLYRYRRLPVVGRQYRVVQALLYSRRVCRALASLHRETPVDIVEFADVNAEGFFWRAGLGKRMIVRCHTPAWVLARYYTRSEQPYDAALLGWAEKRVIHKAHALTAPSCDMAQVISTDCGLPLERICPIPNALDIEAFVPAQTVHPPDRLTILAVGRLERPKGADVLIEAIPQVCEQVPEAHFVIVGSALGRTPGVTYHDYMRAYLAPQLAAGQVDIRGFVPDSDLLKTYHESDISVVPSLLYESFSFTVAQSMACGLPVVASRIGGIPETLDHGKCGILVRPGSVPELVEALVRLARDPDRRIALGKAAREHAVAHFSAEIVAGRILEVYRQTLQT